MLKTVAGLVIIVVVTLIITNNNIVIPTVTLCYFLTPGFLSQTWPPVLWAPRQCHLVPCDTPLQIKTPSLHRHGSHSSHSLPLDRALRASTPK